MLISINTTQARLQCDIFVSESNNNGVRVSLNASKVSQKHQHRFCLLPTAGSVTFFPLSLSNALHVAETRSLSFESSLNWTYL